MSLPQDAEIVFDDEIFVPDINSHPAESDMIRDEEQPAKISPGLKRKAAAEAAKNERCVLPPRWRFPTNTRSARVKRAKDLSATRMVPTMKKPSGVRSGWTPLTTTATHTQPFTVVGQDEDETDQDDEEESKDIKPAGKLMRSSSVGHAKDIRN